MTNSKLSNFIIELHESFHNNPTGSGSSPFLSVVPRLIDIIGRTHDTLSVSRRTHDRFHHTWHAYFFHGLLELFSCRGKFIRRRRQSQLLCSQTTYALPVHSQVGGRRSRCNRIPLFFESHQRICRNSFYFGNDVIWTFRFYHFSQLFAIEHRQNMTAMSDLHSRGIGILIQSNHLHTITLQLYCYFFTQFSTSAKQSFLTDRS